MPQSPTPYVMNQFNQGLKTEYTGLNFPENAAFDTENCIFNRIGNTTRRPGIDYELNFTQQTINRTSLAINTYKWNNVGGDGSTRVLVTQVGTLLRFYKASSATVAAPLSTQILASTVDVSSFVATGGSYDSTKECQFTDGNGYLFVVHPSCDPFYIIYTFGSPDTVAGTRITVQIRDFQGVVDNLTDTSRPNSLTAVHQYNLQNQGWTSGNPWSVTVGTGSGHGATTFAVGAGKIFDIASQSSVLASAVGKSVIINVTHVGILGPSTGSATITGYTSPTTVTLNIGSVSGASVGSSVTSIISGGGSITIQLVDTGFLNTWNTNLGNYPSNADQWWSFKDSSGLYNPTATITNSVNLNSGPAPKGYYILDAFDQQRDLVSSLTITDITTTVRPKTGCWFGGRIWYAGVDAQQNATGTAPNYTWSENIYYSQIIQKEDQFGKCYQTNDPTSENLFDLLPTDGGTFKLQGCGSVFKLFPYQNGLLVFAANGVWFITGSQGIGFAANDFTVVRISTIQSISSTSFVDVQGTPMWWNEEAIYTVTASDQGTAYGPTRGALSNSSVSVQPITYTSIQTFYESIPLQSKKYVRGEYDPINWEIRWLYKTTNETSVTTRYQFDGLLTFSTITQAFSPWTVSTTIGVPYVHAVNFIQGPGGSTSPDPILKYLSSVISSGPTYKFTFAEERDITRWVDWHSSGTDYNFSSFFITGYGIKGMAQHKFQLEYLYLYLNNLVNCSYRLQSIWDYAISGNSGKYSSLERVDINESTSNFSVVHRRHRLRGRGLCLQFRVLSVDGAPFDIIGWSADAKVNTGI